MLTRSILGLAAATMLLALAPAAHAQNRDYADFVWDFTTSKPNATTGVVNKLVYKSGETEDAKPSMIRRVVLTPPAGTVIENASRPQCVASDEDYQLRSRQACPANTKIGDGNVVVITGFGPPLDPFKTGTDLFNTSYGFDELVYHPETGAFVAIERLRREGGSIVAEIREAPGGPPDGKSGVRSVDINIAATAAWMRTPSTCPASGQWTSSGTFTFYNGITVTETDTTPCDRPAAKPKKKSPPKKKGRPKRKRKRGGSSSDRPRRHDHRTALSAAGI